MTRLPVLALLGTLAIAAPAGAQEGWRCANPDCSLIEPAWGHRFHAPPPSPWAPRHDPWLAPQWHQPPPAPIITRQRWLSQHDPRAWGEPPRPWHAEDDRRHGRWRGHGLFD